MLLLDTKDVMTTSEKEIMKQKTIATATPEIILGRVIRKKVTSGGAPRLAAASSNV